MARRAGLFAKNDDTDPVANHSHSNEVTDRGPELSGGEPAANPGPPDPQGPGSDTGVPAGDPPSTNPSSPAAEPTTEPITSTMTAEERLAAKQSNFSRLAGGRVGRILDTLTQLTHLANTGSYSWTQAQQDKIFNAIHERLKEVQTVFEVASRPKEKKEKGKTSFEV